MNRDAEAIIVWILWFQCELAYRQCLPNEKCRKECFNCPIFHGEGIQNFRIEDLLSCNCTSR